MKNKLKYTLTHERNCPWLGVHFTDAIFAWRCDNVVFSDDGDNTYSYSTSNYDIFYLINSNPLNVPNLGSYYIKYNFFGPRITSPSGNYEETIYSINRLSKTRILFSNARAGMGEGNRIMCDLQNLPPSTPSTFTASASGKTVSLAWSDNSTDETGFKVLRKDILTGSYNTITTTSADATTYSDTVTDNGSYWYRVSATNSNGDSVGSKVVKVDVEWIVYKRKPYPTITTGTIFRMFTLMVGGKWFKNNHLKNPPPPVSNPH